jgi:hypothetical protein
LTVEPEDLCWPVVVVGAGVVDVGVVEVDVGVVPIEGPELVLVGTHEARTLLTGPVPGGTSADVGVPGGTLTLKVNVCPVSSVTVTVHWSAEADGSAVIASPASIPHVVATAIASLRLLTALSRANNAAPADDTQRAFRDAYGGSALNL